jgi:predicted nuclease with RNAse H fold/predicted enzyme related to lactoylglutathione lyase
MECWLGVDVGGKRKGFDVAVIDDRRLLKIEGQLNRTDVVELVETYRPKVVAIDSPRCCAPDKDASRAGERELAKAICGIRWTPDETRVRADNPYYAWIVEGLALYDALASCDVEVIEVFPTASWTRWHGRRGSRSRSAWSREGLAGLGLEGVPLRTNQDQRDAIAAAATAHQHTQGETQAMGEIVVPTGARERISSTIALAGVVGSTPAVSIEFPADDPERARRFWERLLAVELDVRQESEGEGWQTRSGAPAVGVHARGRGPGDSFSLPYFAVSNIAEALERVKALEGHIVHPGEQWAICKDSEGNPFGLSRV